MTCYSIDLRKKMIEAHLKGNTSIHEGKLIFIDETGFWVGMSRAVARALRGQKAYQLREFYRGKKLTMIGAIKQGEVLATKTIEKSMKSEDF